MGVICGCLIGMTNLLVIDLKAAERAKKEKELAKIMKTVMAPWRAIPEFAIWLWLKIQQLGLRMLVFGSICKGAIFGTCI